MLISSKYSKLILSILTLLCSYLPIKAEISTREQAEAEKYTSQFLKQRGYKHRSLECKLHGQCVLLLTDKYYNDFLLLVRADHASKVNERVLAYSLDMPSSYVSATGKKGITSLIKYYDVMIKYMKEDLPLDTLNVAPLLKGIAWDQLYINQVWQGQKEDVLTGCGPTAAAQIMKWYEWPQKIEGKETYTDKEGHIISYDVMENMPLTWDIWKNKYNNNGGKKNSEIEPVMRAISTAFHVEYGHESTGTQTNNIYHAMIEHFGYSPVMYPAYDGLTQNELLQLIRNELQQGRPVLMCGFDHLFVCDGLKEGYMHFCMGWGGSFDGWYRFPSWNKPLGDQSLFKSALLHILPDTLEHRKEVIVDAPNTLANYLTLDEQQSVTHLKVTGPIGSNDICLLRQMSGATDREAYRTHHGHLTELDLWDAQITEDSTDYYTFDASAAHNFVFVNNQKYEFDKMTHNLWMELSQGQTRLANNGIYYTEDEPGKKYTNHNFLQRNIVGNQMFRECYNLRSLVLPRNAHGINSQAMAFCPNLKSVILPATLYRISENAFVQDRNLQTVNVSLFSKKLLEENLNRESNRFIWKESNKTPVITYYEDKQDSIGKKVTILKAGTLDQHIADEERYNLTHLSISGPINGRDIRLLRYMTGTNNGQLRYLDLSNARIIKDTAEYFSYDAVQTNYRVYIGNKQYKFSEMTHEKWLEICAKGKDKDRDRYLTEDEPGKKYTVHITTDNDLFGLEMLRGSVNLQDILLPKSVRLISSFALANCPILQNVTLPEAMISSGINVFVNDPMLSKVRVRKGSKTSAIKTLDKTDSNFLFKNLKTIPEFEFFE